VTGWPTPTSFGECDFLLSLSDPLPRLRSPLLAVVEAKKHDIDAGLGQCIAQMVGSQAYNEHAGVRDRPVFGCVTTGEAWQFLGLAGTAVTMHPSRFYINDVGHILAALGRCFEVATS